MRDEHVRAELVDRLGPDPRVASVAGLVLRKPYEGLGLPAWVRIVESGPLTDIHGLADLELPVRLQFFDCHGINGLNFASPLFGIKGFSLELLVLDVMHVVDLGVAQYLVGALFRILLEGDVAGCGSDNVAVRRAEGMKHPRCRMRALYKPRPRARGEMSAIGKLSEAMLGPLATPRLKAKAAETRNLCPLLPQLCAEHAAILAELGPRALHLRVCCT